MSLIAWIMVGAIVVVVACFHDFGEALGGRQPKYIPEGLAVFGFFGGIIVFFVGLLLLFVLALVGVG